jgi:hypothetical protein
MYAQARQMGCVIWDSVIQSLVFIMVFLGSHLGRKMQHLSQQAVWRKAFFVQYMKSGQPVIPSVGRFWKQL